MNAFAGHGLYVVTPPGAGSIERLTTLVTAAIDGGARVVQYRDKSDDAGRRLAEARALSALCRARRVTLIVNDDVALAREAGAHGVHVGRDDASVTQARTTLGPDAIVGATCHASIELALAAARDGADYVAFGSFFVSPTKPHAPPAPLSLVREARAAVPLPIVAIGGITPANAGALVDAGVSYLAVVSGVFGDLDPRAAARRYATLFDTPARERAATP